MAVTRDERVHRGIAFCLGEPYVLLVSHHPGPNFVDGFPVHKIPKRDLAQPRILFIGDCSVRLGPDIQEQISAFSSGLDQRVNQFRSRLVVLVCRLPRPLRSHREITLPCTRKSHSWSILLWSLHNATRNDKLWLQGPSIIGQLLGRTVEEEVVDWAILRQKFFQLAFRVVHEFRNVLWIDALHMPVDGDVVLIKPPEVVGGKVNADRYTLVPERC